MLPAYNACCIYSKGLHNTVIMEANNLKLDQSAKSSLIKLQIVCNTGYQNTKADERADGNCHKWFGLSSNLIPGKHFQTAVG